MDVFFLRIILSSLLLALLVFAFLAWRGVRVRIAVATAAFFAVGIGATSWLALILFDYVTLD